MRTHIAAYMTKHANFFAPRMNDYLKNNHLTFEGYVMAVVDGAIWCNLFVAGAISRMWNISITVISPAFPTPKKIFHDSSKHNIVIIANGLCFTSGHRCKATHFTATEKNSPKALKIGHDIEHLNVKYCHGFVEGQKVASKAYEVMETDKILKVHYDISKKLAGLKTRVEQAELILHEIEDQLEELDILKDDLHCFHAYMDGKGEQIRKRKLAEELNISESDSEYEPLQTSGNRIPRITRSNIMGDEIMAQKRKHSSSPEATVKRKPTSTVGYDSKFIGNHL